MDDFLLTTNAVNVSFRVIRGCFFYYHEMHETRKKETKPHVMPKLNVKLLLTRRLLHLLGFSKLFTMQPKYTVIFANANEVKIEFIRFDGSVREVNGAEHK